MRNALTPLALAVGLWIAACPAQENGPSKPSADKGARSVTIDLTDDSHLVGTLPGDISFPVDSADLKAGIAIKWVDTITMSEDHKTVTITMQNGDRIEGALDMKPVLLAMAIGNVPVDLRFVKSIIVSAIEDPASTSGLVFWNKLASEDDAKKSTVGPALSPYTNGDALEVVGAREFLTGDHGGAITIKGSYQSAARVHNLVLGDLGKFINPEQGCIEFWYCQAGRPVAYQYGVYRMFDGDYGLGAAAQFFADAESLVFSLDCGGGRQIVTCPVTILPDMQWVHLAATWNQKGIEGTQETMRIYLNGKKVAASNAANWGNTVGGRADICGGNDRCAGKFLMNNLKIWNRAKTNFDTGKPPDVEPKKLENLNE